LGCDLWERCFRSWFLSPKNWDCNFFFLKKFKNPILCSGVNFVKLHSITSLEQKVKPYEQRIFKRKYMAQVELKGVYFQSFLTPRVWFSRENNVIFLIKFFPPIRRNFEHFWHVGAWPQVTNQITNFQRLRISC
jgi:hypothetical protein